MKHMGNDERNRIEFMLGCGSNVASIAKALGRSECPNRRTRKSRTGPRQRAKDQPDASQATASSLLAPGSGSIISKSGGRVRAERWAEVDSGM